MCLDFTNKILKMNKKKRQIFMTTFEHPFVSLKVMFEPYCIEHKEETADSMIPLFPLGLTLSEYHNESFLLIFHHDEQQVVE
jgi:hypothetical protein